MATLAKFLEIDNLTNIIIAPFSSPANSDEIDWNNSFTAKEGKFHQFSAGGNRTQFTIELKDLDGSKSPAYIDCQYFFAHATTTINGKRGTLKVPFHSKTTLDEISNEIHGVNYGANAQFNPDDEQS